MTPAEVAAPGINLRPGEPLEVWILNGEDTETYSSRIEDAHDDVVVIATPMRKLDVVPVKVGTQLSLRVPREDALFVATARAEQVATTPLPMVHCKVSGPWKREQRRKSVRLATNLLPTKVELRVGEEERAHPLHLTVKNLSTTGLLMVSRRQSLRLRTDLGPIADAKYLARHRYNSELHLLLPLSDIVVETVASITRLEEVEDVDEFLYRVAGRFINMDRRQEEAVFKYIFEEQLRLRRREL